MIIDMIRDSSFDKLTWVVVELISTLCEETIDEECNKFIFFQELSAMKYEGFLILFFSNQVSSS